MQNICEIVDRYGLCPNPLPSADGGSLNGLFASLAGYEYEKPVDWGLAWRAETETGSVAAEDELLEETEESNRDFLSLEVEGPAIQLSPLWPYRVWSRMFVCTSASYRGLTVGELEWQVPL